MIHKILTMGFMGLLAIGATMYVPSAFGQGGGVVCVNVSTGTVTTVASFAECTQLNHSTTTGSAAGSVVVGEEKQAGNVVVGEEKQAGNVVVGEEKHVEKVLAGEEKKLGIGGK
jgi:hypothetical protein